MKHVSRIGLLALTLSACNPFGPVRDPLDDWSPDLAAPVAFAEFTLGDLTQLFDTLAWLRLDPGGQYYLHYEADLGSYGFPEFFEIEDFQDRFDSARTATSFPLQFLELGIVRSGQIGYVGFYSEPDSALMTVTFDRVFEPGSTDPYVLTRKLPGPGPFQGQVDLAGLQVAPDDLLVESRYTLVSLTDGSSYPLDSMRLTYSNLRLAFAEGYFPSYVFEIDSAFEAVEIDLPDDLPFPRLGKPAVALIVDNEFGVPNEFRATDFRLSYPDGTVVPLQDSTITAGFSLNYPQTRGNSAETIIELGPDNSNLRDIVAAIPNRIDYAGEMAIFPDADPNETGFVHDTAQLHVRMEADFPLEFALDPWTWEQWFAWDSLGLDEGGQATLRLESRNGFPVEVSLELFAADADSQIIAPIFADPIAIEAPALSSEGRALQAADQLQFIPLSPEILPTLQRAAYLFARVRLSTPSQGQDFVQLYATDEFYFKLGLRYEQ